MLVRLMGSWLPVAYCVAVMAAYAAFCWVLISGIKEPPELHDGDWWRVPDFPPDSPSDLAFEKVG